MSIHVALNHVTHYRYDRLISLSPQVVRLRPAPHSRTPILSYSLKVTPAQHFINWQQDPQGNYLARLVFPEKTREFWVEVDLVAEMSVINPFDFFPEPYATTFPFKYEDWQQEELEPYLHRLPRTPLLRRFLDTIPAEPRPASTFLVDINRRVQQAVGYVIRLEPGVQTPEETLELARGSCRDSAWLLVQVLRHLGLAARFVSGYLIQLVPDVKSLDGPSAVRPAISPICTPGARSICRVPAGSASIRPPACSPAKGIFRWPVRHNRLRLRRSPASPRRANARSSTA